LESKSLATPVDVINWGKKVLKEGGIEDFTVSAEILLAHLLGKKRSEILIDNRSETDSGIIEKYKKLIKRRLTKEPLQYITGINEFYNVSIKCDKRALIPRPETEILCETTLELLKDNNTPKILDIGTGSGAIALALRRNMKKSRIIGTDISLDALDLANENIKVNNVNSGLEFVSGDIFDDSFVKSLGKFDCVVSNPPYVAENEKEILQPDVIDHEPHVALFSPGDSLAFYKRIIEITKLLLDPDGLLAFETGYDQASKVVELMNERFDSVKVIKDLAGIDRVVTGLAK